MSRRRPDDAGCSRSLDVARTVVGADAVWCGRRPAAAIAAADARQRVGHEVDDPPWGRGVLGDGRSQVLASGLDESLGGQRVAQFGLPVVHVDLGMRRAEHRVPSNLFDLFRVILGGHPFDGRNGRPAATRHQVRIGLRRRSISDPRDVRCPTRAMFAVEQPTCPSWTALRQRSRRSSRRGGTFGPSGRWSRAGGPAGHVRSQLGSRRQARPRPDRARGTDRARDRRRPRHRRGRRDDHGGPRGPGRDRRQAPDRARTSPTRSRRPAVKPGSSSAT